MGDKTGGNGGLVGGTWKKEVIGVDGKILLKCVLNRLDVGHRLDLSGSG
jgi:hypothetical protein